MRKRTFILFGLAAALSLPSTSAEAGFLSKAFKEAGEYAMKKLGRKASREGAESITDFATHQARRHGDDVLPSLRVHPSHALTPPAPQAASSGLDSALTTLGNHPGKVAAGVGLATFFKDPTPFLTAGGTAIAPVSKATGTAIEETAHALVWPLAGLAACGVGWVGFSLFLRGKSQLAAHQKLGPGQE